MLGAPIGDRAARARIGYLPELFRYQPWLRAREVLALHAELAGLAPGPGARRPPTRPSIHVGLTERADDPVSGFSKGMQQRLGLGVALLGEPELILLDEPTSALDPVGRTDVRAIVRAARDRGRDGDPQFAPADRGRAGLRPGRDPEPRPGHRIGPARRGRGRRRRSAPGRPDSTTRDTRCSGAFGPVAIDGEWLSIRPLDATRIPEVVAAVVAAGGRVHAVEPGRGSLEARFLELVAAPPEEPA